MKPNYTIIFFLCLLASMNSYAGRITSKEVPQAVTEASKIKDSKGQALFWKKDKNTYVHHFNMEGQRYQSRYTGDGQWMDTRTHIDKDEVPDTVRAVFKKSAFANWKLTKVHSLETPVYGNVYELKVRRLYYKKTRLFYNATGKLVLVQKKGS